MRFLRVNGILKGRGRGGKDRFEIFLMKIRPGRGGGF
jgi:hypothetical protein